jgi:hypothetical protein
MDKSLNDFLNNIPTPSEGRCTCGFCHGEGCSSCPDCLDRIYEYDHPKMDSFVFWRGEFPDASEEV